MTRTLALAIAGLAVLAAPGAYAAPRKAAKPAATAKARRAAALVASLAAGLQEMEEQRDWDSACLAAPYVIDGERPLPCRGEESAPPESRNAD